MESELAVGLPPTIQNISCTIESTTIRMNKNIITCSMDCTSNISFTL
jgi:hypothetical protein